MPKSAIRQVCLFTSLLSLSPFGLAACLSEQDAPAPEDYGTLSDSLTTRLEGESQSWTTTSGDSISASSSNARLNANASGDTFSFSKSVTAGTYTVVARYAKRSLYGNYRLEANGQTVGTLQGYAGGSSDSWTTVTLGNVALSGNVTFRFVSTGKDSAASDFDIKVDYLELRSTSSAPTTPTSNPSTPTTPTSTPTTPTSPGTASCTIPSANGQQSVSSTIKVSGTLDGGYKRYVGAGSLGSSDQTEDQGPLFELESGATLKNVIIGSPAADGVHCKGTCRLENVYWEDVGEDAATLKGSSSSQVMTVVGGAAKSASDKVFQHNGPGKFVIQNFCAENIGKLYRSCGNCDDQYKREVTIDNVIVKGAKVVAGINTNYGDVARFTRIQTSGSPVICDKYTGVTDGEPKHIGSGADGKNCIYQSSDITQL